MMTNEITRAVDELTGIEQGIATAVAVGASAGSGTGYLLSAALLQGRHRLPELAVTVSEGTREVLLRQLRTGKLDLVVGAAGDNALPPDLDGMPLYIDAPFIVCGTRHALATKRAAWTDMVVEPWVLPPQNTRVRAALEALFRRVGATRPRVLAETLSLDLILELLVGGTALAVLPQHLGRRLVTAGQVRKLDVDTPGLVMPVSVFTPIGVPVSRAVDTFKQCLIEAAAKR